jgi:putative acetyltransferase
VKVRAERPADTDVVKDVHAQAFGRKHGELVAALVSDLRTVVAADDRLSLVAEHEGGVIGHVLFSRGWLDASPRLVDVQVLSPVGVLPEHQRAGVGTALIRCGLETLAGRGVPAVFLEGDPDYYRRLGFSPAAPLGFRKPSLRIPDAAFQVILLPSHEPWMTGTLVYAEPFWRRDVVGLRA